MRPSDKLLSIDYGKRKSGIAVSIEGFSFSVGTYPTHDLQKILEKLIRERKIKKIILGMPYNIDGSMSEHGNRVHIFGKSLENLLNIPIEYFDERLTTAEARMSFDHDGVAGDIDAESARLILERYRSDT